MARVLVMTDDRKRVLLDETVTHELLEDEQSSLQVIERLAWAVADAAELRTVPKLTAVR